MASSCAVGFLVAVSALDAQRVATPQPTLAQLTLSLVLPVRSGTTLGAWRVAHPADTVSRSGDESLFGIQCANARRQVALADGDTVGVVIFFYVPPIPKHTELPLGVSPDDLLDRCRAGGARVILRDSSDSRTLSLKRALESALTAARIADSISPWSGVEPGDRDGTYRLKDSVALTAMRFSGMEADGKGGAVNMHGIGVMIHAKRSQEVGDVLLPGDVYDGTSVADQRVTRRILAAFAEAGIGGTTERDLRKLLDQLGSAADDSNADPVVGALSRWTTAAKSLPKPRQAAALLVADAVLHRWRDGYFLADSNGRVLRDHLTDIGASLMYQRDKDGGEWYSYSANWLAQAYHMAPSSRAGELAFLTLAESGFRTLVPCDSMAPTVIGRGTEYLRRYPRSAIRGEIHLLIGAAWSDVLGSAPSDDPPVSGDAIRRRHLDEESARAHAIAEFALAFRIAPDRAQTRAVWEDAWRLMAGLGPRRGFFDCGDD